MDKIIYEKPADKEDAFLMLKKLEIEKILILKLIIS